MRRRRSQEIISGRVNSDGSIAAGDGFTVNKAGTGAYDFTFGPGFRLIAIAPVVSTGTARIITTSGYTERGARVAIYTTGVVLQDDGFAFIATGIQQ